MVVFGVGCMLPIYETSYEKLKNKVFLSRHQKDILIKPKIEEFFLKYFSVSIGGIHLGINYSVLTRQNKMNSD